MVLPTRIDTRQYANELRLANRRIEELQSEVGRLLDALSDAEVQIDNLTEELKAWNILPF